MFEPAARRFVGRPPFVSLTRNVLATHMFKRTLLVLDAADRHAAERARSQGAACLPCSFGGGGSGLRGEGPRRVWCLSCCAWRARLIPAVLCSLTAWG